jgi:hypothetical protein
MLTSSLASSSLLAMVSKSVGSLIVPTPIITSTGNLSSRT